MRSLLAGVLVVACIGCGDDDDDDDVIDASGPIDATAIIDAIAYDAAPPSPTDVAGLVLWLDAEDLSDLTDEDPVGLWADRSTAGNDAIGPKPGATSPRWKRFEANGKATVRFDGLDDPLEGPDLLGTGTDTTIFVVSRRDMTIPDGGSAVIDVGDTDRAVLGYSQFLGQPRFRVDKPEGRAIAFSESTSDELSVISARKNGDRVELFVDTELEASGTAAFTSTFTGGGFRIGGSFATTPATRFAGDISEVLVYDRALSDTDRAFVEQLLLSEYTITASTDTSYLPNEIPGMLLWLNASFADQRADTEVTEWLDFGGAQNDASLPSGTGPMLVDDIVFGKLLRFAGAEQLQLAANPVAAPSNFSIFAVARRNTASGSGSAIVGLRESGASGCMLDYGGAGSANPRFLVRDSSGLAGIAQASTERTDLIVMHGTLSGTTVALRVNGSPQATVDGGFIGTFDWDDFAIGAANGPVPLVFGGDIGDVLIFDRVLTATEYNQLEFYLRSKHNIP